MNKCVVCKARVSNDGFTTALYIMDESIYPIYLCNEHKNKKEVAKFIEEKINE